LEEIEISLQSIPDSLKEIEIIKQFKNEKLSSDSINLKREN